MTDVKVLWLVTLSLFLVAQSLLLAMKLLRNRSAKKTGAGPSYDGRITALEQLLLDKKKEENPGYGERIASLETDVEGLKETNEKDHTLIMGDIRKLFNLFNNRRGRE